jgi:hypothetical protein
MSEFSVRHGSCLDVKNLSAGEWISEAEKISKDLNKTLKHIPNIFKRCPRLINVCMGIFRAKKKPLA